MTLHERLVYGVLGAMWGAVLGLLLAMFFHLVLGANFDNGFLIIGWKNTILGCAAIFALVGLIFKSSTGTILGTAMTWVWSAIVYQRESEYGHYWITLLIVAVVMYLIFDTVQGY